MTDSPVTIAVIGAGNRGNAYASYSLRHPELCKVVAIAEPMEGRRKEFAELYGISDPDLIVADYRELAEKPKFCDAIVIAILDQMHYECLLTFAKLGYNILCEKPLATTMKECIEMTEVMDRSDRIFAIGHVLRYSPYNAEIKQMIDSGKLGDIINIVHVEPVGNVHFSHSYVRGNWCHEKDTSFSLMTKCCHDLDLMAFYLGESCMPKNINSFGSLTHFTKRGKPKEAGGAKRCSECAIRTSCPYSAEKVYLDPVKNGYTGWPTSSLTDGEPDIESVSEALRTKRWGECVYELDNDVADHQVVNLEFESGATVSLTMIALTEAICTRQTRIHGTKGEIVGDMNSFTFYDFETKERTTHEPHDDYAGLHGHGGADMGLISTFIEAINKNDQSLLGVTPKDVLKSHLMVFAAEKSRRSLSVVGYSSFVSKLGKSENGATNGTTLDAPKKEKLGALAA